MEGITTRLGENGRVVIPAEYRRALGLASGDEVIMVLVDGEIHILTPAAAVKRARALIRRYIPPARRLADELLAERRSERE